MTGIADQDPLRHEQDRSVRLDHFENEWRTGTAPDLRRYLAPPESADKWYLTDLIQVDLEYRWKQYEKSSDRTAIDQHGFKMFPQLEDYAELDTVSSDDILTADLFAEEYRVRTRWGDRPKRDIYFSRCPDDPTLLEAALHRVETELHIDCSTPNRKVEIDGSDATVDHSKGDSQADSALTDESKIPGQLGRYKLESRIGRGGFGEVWKAYDPTLDRHVAIKFPRPDKRFPARVIADFEKEGQKLAGLQTIPGVVSVYDAGVSDGHVYIVSELIDGESLESRQTRSPLSHQEAAELIAAVAEILHRAHLKDLVHRDIKPGNILLRKDGSPVIADFGLAATETDQLAESEGVVGTLSYMPPEQVNGNSRFANAQADIYSLGVVLYQLLTGRLPFVADSFHGYREQINNRPPRSPRTIDEGIPEKLERVCLRCLEKRPEDRYANSSDLARDLRIAMRSKSKTRLVTISYAGFLILVGLSVLASLNSGGPDPDHAANPSTNQDSKSVEYVLVSNAPFLNLLNDKRVRPKLLTPKGDCDWNLSPDNSYLEIGSTQLALLEFGVFESANYSMELQCALDQSWIDPDSSSTFGLFFGLRKSPSNVERQEEYRYQSTYFYRTVSNAVSVERRQLRCTFGHAKSINVITQPHGQAHQELTDFSKPKDISVFLSVRKGQLAAFAWNREDIRSFSGSYANRSLESGDYLGSFGISIRNCRIKIHSLKVQYLYIQRSR